MKVRSDRAEGFLNNLDAKIGAVLLYGSDIGLIRERAQVLAATVAEDFSDPFRVSELTGAALQTDPARLSDEMSAMSLTGGRRVVRLREAVDRNADIIGELLSMPLGDTLLVVESGDLSPRAPLRKLFEAADNAAAVGCYADEGHGLEQVVEQTLAASNVSATPDALAFLTDSLGGDRLLARSEISKLATYVGDGGQATLEDAIACVGDSAAVTLDDAVMAAADGNLAVLDRALQRAWQEGVSPVALLRGVARHLQRLHLAATRQAGGMAPRQAMTSLRPPVFWKQQQRFERQLRCWSEDLLAAAIGRTLEAEMHCKRTGLPDVSLCHRALMQIANAARRGAARRGN